MRNGDREEGSRERSEDTDKVGTQEPGAKSAPCSDCSDSGLSTDFQDEAVETLIDNHIHDVEAMYQATWYSPSVLG